MDVAEIAKGLTAAQRTAVLEGCCNLYPGNPDCFCGLSDADLGLFARLGLVQRRSVEASVMQRTRQGRDVRAYLERNAK